jgi:hypothetical protein
LNHQRTPSPALEALNAVPPTAAARAAYLVTLDDVALQETADALGESIAGISSQLDAAEAEEDDFDQMVDRGWIARARAARRFKTLDLAHCRRILGERKEARQAAERNTREHRFICAVQASVPPDVYAALWAKADQVA